MQQYTIANKVIGHQVPVQQAIYNDTMHEKDYFHDKAIVKLSNP
jgi:hypothetical protein